MSIGKYLTNPGVIGAAFGAIGTAKQTRQMPNDWRRILVWAIWAAGFALALAGAAKQLDDEAYETAREEAEYNAKLEAKARKKRSQ